MAIASFGASPTAMSLCAWLDGHWAILFSNPEDFAPHPSTPASFHAQIAAQFATLRVKPLAFGCSDSDDRHDWLRAFGHAHTAVGLCGRLGDDDRVIDFTSHALRSRLGRIDSPYVALLDEAARCRLTIRYRPLRTDRPRTLDELLRVVRVLRGGASVHVAPGVAGIARQAKKCSPTEHRCALDRARD